VRLLRLNVATRKGLRVPPSLRGCSIQRLEQSFDFASNEIVTGAKFFYLFSSIDARECVRHLAPVRFLPLEPPGNVKRDFLKTML
jgi:hypothetical protein